MESAQYAPNHVLNVEVICHNGPQFIIGTLRANQCIGMLRDRCLYPLGIDRLMFARWFVGARLAPAMSPDRGPLSFLLSSDGWLPVVLDLDNGAVIVTRTNGDDQVGQQPS